MCVACSRAAHHHRRRPPNPTGLTDACRRPPTVNESTSGRVWIICSLSATFTLSNTLCFHWFCMIVIHMTRLARLVRVCILTRKFDRYFPTRVFRKISLVSPLPSLPIYCFCLIAIMNDSVNECEHCLCTVCVIRPLFTANEVVLLWIGAIFDGF